MMQICALPVLLRPKADHDAKETALEQMFWDLLSLKKCFMDTVPSLLEILLQSLLHQGHITWLKNLGTKFFRVHFINGKFNFKDPRKFA